MSSVADCSRDTYRNALPRFTPRAPVAQQSSTTSSRRINGLSRRENEAEAEGTASGSGNEESSIARKHINGAPMPMPDFLAAVPVHPSSFLEGGVQVTSARRSSRSSASPAPSSSGRQATQIEQLNPISHSTEAASSRRVHSLRLIPKAAKLEGSSLVVPRMSTGSQADGSHSGRFGSASADTHGNGSMTAWEFLLVDPLDKVKSDSEGRGATASMGASGRRRSNLPHLKVKIIPVTESIVMFGSTQTSSNYSVSGKVVLDSSTHRKDARQISQSMSDSFIRWRGSSSDFSRNGSPGNVSEAEDDALGLSGSDSEASKQVVRLLALRVTFTGYALYADHTGRFSAVKLACVSQDLLPQGASIPCHKGTVQKHEIEFNLSVPGWLPASMTTRFGGTFYCLQADLDYDAGDAARAKVSEGLHVPSRTASRTSSPSPLSSAVDVSNCDLCAPLPADDVACVRAEHALTRESSHKSNLSTSRRVRNEPLLSSSPGAVGARNSWIGKTARHLQRRSGRGILSSSPSSPAGSMLLTAAAQDGEEPSSVELEHRSRSPQLLRSPSGICTVSSKTRTIRIARCREVVPVPVARMAVIGLEGLPDGAHQDPPPTPQATSEDSPFPSLRSTMSAPERQPSSPPPLPSAFNAPLDPAKFAAHASSQQPPTPLRASSASHSSETSSAPRNAGNRSAQHGTVPMRHFLHRPMLHPPAEAQISADSGGLPFSLTLTLPSYVSVDGPASDLLSFGLQIEVGKSSAWAKVREMGGLRLRDMELSCVQTERHSSVASRTFCNSYALPPDPAVAAQDLPILDERRRDAEGRLQQPAYDRALVLDHLELVRQGRVPRAAEQNVERVRTALVGPPPNHAGRRSQNEPGRSDDRGKGKERDPGRDGAPMRKERRRSMPVSASASSALAVNAADIERSSAAPTAVDVATSSVLRHDQDEDSIAADTRRGGRGRRAYQSALRGLSNLATAVMDISLDLDGAGGGSGNAEDAGSNKKRKDGREAQQSAVYSFAGSDGHGVDLTKGRVRMAINLPLVSHDADLAKASGAPRLVADFESPFIRIRHKLKVRLGFGFGSKPLGGEGEDNWGQALVMCVPVRFTDAAPREVREQFAPLPIAQVSATDPTSSSLPAVKMVGANDAPILPSYNQLFREDGSRLADEGEDLPQYPGPRHARTRRMPLRMPSSGSVSAQSPVLASAVLAGEGGASAREEQQQQQLPRSPGFAEARFDNRIAPARVVDESLPIGQSTDQYTRQQRLELEEIEMEEEQEFVHAHLQGADRMNETVNMDDGEGEEDVYNTFGADGRDIDRE